MLGALIGAGASLLSSIFGSDDDEPKTTTSSVDYVKMVQEAEKAGFNPLTALRNGGSAGFSTMTTSGTSTPLSKRILGGIGDATQNFLANFDPFKDQKREMETRLVEAQLANLQADTANKVRFGDVPTYTAGREKRVMGGGVAPGQTFASASDVLAPPVAPTPGKTTYTNPWQEAYIDKRVRDASAMEERYGDSELATMIYGAHVANADMRANSDRYTRFGDDAKRWSWDRVANFPQDYDRFLDKAAVSAPWNIAVHPRSGRSAKTGRLSRRYQ